MKNALIKLALIFLTATSPAWATACDNATVGGYTCVQQCQTHLTGSNLTAPCVFSSSPAAGNVIYIMGWESTAGVTLSFVQTSCLGIGAITKVGSDLSNNSDVEQTQAWAPVSATAACTFSLATGTAGELLVIGVELHGTNQTLRSGSGALASLGFLGSGSTLTSPAATTVSGDLVVGVYVDAAFNGRTYTATGGGAILAHITDSAIIANTASTTSTSITATASSGTVAGSGAMAFEIASAGGVKRLRGKVIQ